MRLIDADALIEMIDKDIQMTEKYMNEITEPSEMASKKYASLFSQLNTLKSYKSIIDEQPTAYDPEKAVAELEEISEIHCKEYHKEEGSLYLQDAIKIVRKGGVE